MVSNAQTGVVARVQRVVRDQLAAVGAQISRPPTPEQTRGLTYSRGDLVTDLVTGQPVEVVRGERVASISAAPRSFGG